ncbi:hypothetical protein [Methanosarcina sp.]|uniref:hypothetical protein n=1 Tax=Methanosarcina sp. TaxID=2213 RepID=UPI002B561D43|nr:hypothetical protein [Methanosarcina sp.]HOW13497.1 hypothetical protein [Methanosarcina sp.]
MLIDIRDNLLDLAEMYLERYPILADAVANADDNEFEIRPRSVQLLFSPVEPESTITVKRIVYIGVDLDAGNALCQNHTCIYIPKKYVDHPRTVYAIFLDGVWINRYAPVDAVFLTKREADQYMECEKEYLKHIGVNVWK